MMFSVCIDAVLPGDNLLKKLTAVKDSGGSCFEFWSWWDKDLDVLKTSMEQTEMKLTAMCTKMVSLTEASNRDEYIKGLRESIEAAKMLGCNMLISQVGNDTGTNRTQQHQSISDGLKACTPYLNESGVTIVIEPLNTVIDHKGHYLLRSEEAFDIIDEVGSPYVKVLYDIYHQQIIEGNLLNTIESNLNKIGHMHAAGLPGRTELYNSEINYSYIFNAIDAMGYTGCIGLEYFPKDDPVIGLKQVLMS